MRALLFVSALACIFQAVSASEDFVDPKPVPRYLRDPTVIQKRDDSETNHSTVVSLVTWTPQSQRIIDMAKFGWALKAARCTEDMMLQFRHNISFQAAKRERRFTVACADCGVRGSLEFAGHVEGSVSGGLDRLVLSARPLGLGAALNLEATLKGSTISRARTGLIRSLSSSLSLCLWVGEYQELRSIEAQATITASISATISDSSIAKFHLISEEKVQVEGWAPKFDFQPPTLEAAALKAKGKVWGKVAVAVSLEIIDENGITADVHLKVPLSIEAEMGYNSEGFCDDSSNCLVPRWNSMSAPSSAWRPGKEVDGKKDVFFNQVLFEDLEVPELPSICLSFGDAPEGSCISADMDEEMATWWDNERAVLVPRAEKRRSREEEEKWKYYNLKCDPRVKYKTHSKWPIWLKHCPPPPEIRDNAHAGNPVPIMQIGINLPGCSTEPDAVEPCHPKSEHVYEGNWIRNFLNDLQAKHFPGDSGCEQLAKDVFKIGQADGPADGMLNRIGNDANYDKAITLFPVRENGYKFRIDIPFGGDRNKLYTVLGGTCALGRIVATCQYMEHAETRKRLKYSIREMDAVLAKLEQDASAPKPGTLTSYQEAHKQWFIAMYASGIENLQDHTIKAAEYLTHPDRKTDYDRLPQDITDRIELLVSANATLVAKELCPGTFVYP
ncbi:hypothetical protein N657DRAFT_702672 [Parathielavia appendiculata]|uniref:DUF7223 domain-containing protein n=1 Tax=Parathielavia appendiculata TaxID=2587402 RepID=A0AAN6TSZ5_9PEZI|nr:hypothetical protein N657DRAFT_702672 [Parathielavia appendiculata]